MGQNRGFLILFVLWSLGLLFSDSGVIGAFSVVEFVGGVCAFVWLRHWRRDHPLRFQRLGLS